MSTFIAATVPVQKKGQTSSLMQAAQAISLEPKKSINKKDLTPVFREPKPGSYERQMAMFGKSLVREE